MARPTSFDREEAVETAMHAVWENGYENTSVKQLAEMLGITRSSFYNAFGSREELFRAFIPKYAAQSPDAMLRQDVTGDVLLLITVLYREICKVRAQDPKARGCLLINSVAELCPSQEGLGALLATLVLGSVDRIEELLDVAVENGELPASSNTRAIALALQNLMVGINVICKVVRSEDELWLLTETTLRGLGLYRDDAFEGGQA